MAGFHIKDVLRGKAASLIHMETGPGLGCTEPAAIGLASAAAASLFEGAPVESIRLTTDGNLHRNAMGVVIPNSGGRASVALAAAMGAVAGEADKRLQVFAPVDEAGLGKALALVDSGKVSVAIDRDRKDLFVQAAVSDGNREAVCTIRDIHDNIAELVLDGAPRPNHPLLSRTGGDDAPDVEELEAWLLGLDLPTILAQLDTLEDEDLDSVSQGLELNRALAEHGLEHGPGLGVGKAHLGLKEKGTLDMDMAQWAGTFAAAGIDARMGGVALPAMTLGGSGNQGIAAGASVLAAAESAGINDQDKLLKAVALSYLITILIKVRVGRLSALCGSAVAAGAGAAAATTYLLGGDVRDIGGAVTNHIENTATLICDGAKTSCALKVGEAVTSAVKSALLALDGVVVHPVDGIVGASAEESVANLGRLSSEGLGAMTGAILDIMLEKCP